MPVSNCTYSVTTLVGKSNEDCYIYLLLMHIAAYMISRIFDPNIQAWYLEINQINVTFFSECF